MCFLKHFNTVFNEILNLRVIFVSQNTRHFSLLLMCQSFSCFENLKNERKPHSTKLHICLAQKVATLLLLY